MDFPTVWREMSGLDSILQAAGRCNREGGRKAAESTVHIFEGEGRVSAALRLRMAPAAEVLEEYEDINTRAAIECYFAKLLWRTVRKGWISRAFWTRRRICCFKRSRRISA